MHGFKKGVKHRQQLAEGGTVRGAGNGISDEIKARVPSGSYIMPADSTEQIGAHQLSGMGSPVAVNLSNGEYQLPPEQVHAIGVRALDAMRDATHVPAGLQAKGFHPQKPKGASPELFFADGGAVDEEQRKKSQGLTPQSVNAESQPVAVSDSGAASASLNDPAAVNAAAQQQSNSVQNQTEGPLWRTLAVKRGAGEEVSNLWNNDEHARSIGTAVRGGAALIPAAFADGAEEVVSASRPVINFGKGLVGWQDAPPAQQQPPVSRSATLPSVSLSSAAAAAIPARGDRSQPGNASDQWTRTGSGLGFHGGEIVSRAGANGVPEFTNESVAQASAQPLPEGGVGRIGDGRGTFSQGDPGDSQRALQSYERANQERARMIAESRRGVMGEGGGRVTVVEDSDLRKSQQNRGFAPSQGSRSASAIKQAQIREQGETQRAALREAAETARFAESHALEQQRTAAELESKGFQTRAARRIEELYAQYDKAKPEERGRVAEQIRVLSGDDAPNRFTVVPGGQGIDADGRAYALPARVINNQTGQFMDQGQTAPAPLQNHIDALKKNPQQAEQFDEIYGAGAASRYLGAR
jgi:hypothetical protein